jgi:hypothetical protein
MFILKATFVVAIFCTFSIPALAGPPCAEHDSMVRVLDGKYKEKLSTYGVAGHKDKVEVFVSKSGTFTILSTRPDGISCVIAAGEDWEMELKNLTSL